MAHDNLIEVSFEVANKVGGIYQVLKSKSSKMSDFYGDHYLTIGPYNEEAARKDFAPRQDHPYEDLFEALRKKGIECYYGVWEVSGSPKCILVDASGMQRDVDDIKTEMWEKYDIDSMNTGSEFDDPVRWSYAVGLLINRLEEKLENDTVVHLHEWLSGPAMFNFDSPKVFTTHATVLGRTLSDSDFNLREAVKNGNVNDKMAEEHGVKAKHQLEKTAAETADVFTTVSKTTGEEAEAVLDVKPDKILPNGFNVEEYPSLEELSYNHRKEKQEFKSFLQAYFKPYYDVDLDDDPRVLYISGRYEFHNKGIDLMIDALSQVNDMEGDDFFVFIFVPSDVKGEKLEVLENVSLYEELEDYIDSAMPELRENLLNSITSGKEPSAGLEDVIKGTRKLESLQANFHTKKEKTPPLSAFDLNYDNDEIMEALWDKGLRNRKEDRVKIVFYPTYLSVGDKLLSMDYNDAVVASSAGIFPSYYEPWGYTPVETAANGAMSVTTDLAGFGQFLKENTNDYERKGIKVLERRNRPDSEAAKDLAKMIDDIVSYSKTEITERKHNARKLAQMTSWEKLGENYREAHEKALERSK
ncbi:MAG: glycogen/starch synthase [Candidatus Nanohalobium sp.]